MALASSDLTRVWEMSPFPVDRLNLGLHCRSYHMCDAGACLGYGKDYGMMDRANLTKNEVR